MDERDLAERIEYLETQVDRLVSISVFAFLCLTSLTRGVHPENKEDYNAWIDSMGGRVGQALEDRNKSKQP